MKNQKLINSLREFILKRGWKLKIGKRTPVEQSLFIHSMNELGAIQNYLQIQAYSHPFNESEVVKLYVASIVHDCEKETDEWQEKIYLGEKPPHHTNPEYAKKFTDELLEFLNKNEINVGFNQDDINDVISPQPLHMKASAKNATVVFEEMSRKHRSERWSEIVNLVDLFDDIVSKESIEAVIELLNKDEYRMLNERLEFAYHKTSNVRGILTSLLHKACEKVYEKHGYVPFLYYVDGTLYFKGRKDTPAEEIGVDEIRTALVSVIDKFLSKISPELEIATVIGRPQTRMLLIPEFLRKESISRYFGSIKRKYKNTRKPDKSKLKEIIEHHFAKNAKKEPGLEHIKDADLIETLISDPKNFLKDYPVLLKEFQLVLNASISRPQQYMIQFFKEIVHDILKDEKEFQKAVKTEYDSVFGNGAYDLLKSKSTTMPYTKFDKRKKKQLPGDFERYIEPYWKKEEKINDKNIPIKTLSTEKQEELLEKKLSAILKNNLDKCSKLPKDTFFDQIADLLVLSDIVYPLPLSKEDSTSITEKIKNLAGREVASIGESKEKLFNETKGIRLCPLCHRLMISSNSLSADLLSNEQGIAKVFNNQAIGASRFQTSVNICLLCHAELLLRRVLLGKTPTDTIILFPSLNFAKIQGSHVIETMKDLQTKLGLFFSFHNPNLNVRVQLNNLRNVTTQILEKSAEEISAELNPEKFIETFRIKISDETRKNDLKKLEDKINEIWDTVEDFNKEFHTTYTSFQEIAEDIFENKVKMPATWRNQTIEEAGVNPIHYSFIYETPNFTVISLPMTFSYNKDEAEVNILLKRLLFAMYLYLLTDCAVMVIPGKEVIHIPQTRNIIYIQPNATLKHVIKEDWISLFELKKWMVAISAAVKLAYEGGYSGRSGIFEVLIQPTVGHILNRITSQKTQSGARKRADSRLINILDQLQNTEVLKNETVVDTKI